jgi:hypothetical protein
LAQHQPEGGRDPSGVGDAQANLDTTAALIRYAICNKLVDAWHLSTGTFETDPVKAPEH